MNNFAAALVPLPSSFSIKPMLQHDWRLVRGCRVEIRHSLDRPRVGLVEDVTADGSILWLAAEGPATRTMVQKSEGYEVWTSEEQLPSS
jgi:hypothetical protein